MNRLAADNDPPGDANRNARFWSFWDIRDICEVVVMGYMHEYEMLIFICMNWTVLIFIC